MSNHGKFTGHTHPGSGQTCTLHHQRGAAGDRDHPAADRPDLRQRQSPLCGMPVLLLVPDALGAHRRGPARDLLPPDDPRGPPAPGSRPRDRLRPRAQRKTTTAGKESEHACWIPGFGPPRFRRGALQPVNGVALTVVIVIFVLVGCWGSSPRAGAAAAGQGCTAWTSGAWAAAGSARWITWFLLGGDLYTAYTFVAVPAAMWATGAVSGFFAVPYTVVLYPIVFLLMAGCGPSRTGTASSPRRTSSADATAASALSLAVAVTGIVATMPYIALQLVGIKAVLRCWAWAAAANALLHGPAADHRVRGAGRVHLHLRPARAGPDRRRQGPADLPRGDRRDHLPADQVRRLGPHLRRRARRSWPRSTRPPGKPTGVFIPGAASYSAYWTLALGSAMALFMYPHSITGVLATKSRNTIRRNAARAAAVLADARASWRCWATWPSRPAPSPSS